MTNGNPPALASLQGIVAYADLRLAQTPKGVEAHWQAAPTHASARRVGCKPRYLDSPASTATSSFDRSGFPGRLRPPQDQAVFDAWCFHPQLGEY